MPSSHNSSECPPPTIHLSALLPQFIGVPSSPNSSKCPPPTIHRNALLPQFIGMPSSPNSSECPPPTRFGRRARWSWTRASST
eukprot:7380475-Prymnesium_polylepis.2